MEALCSSEASLSTHNTTLCQMPGNCSLNVYCMWCYCKSWWHSFLVNPGNLKILDTRKVTWSVTHTEDPQVLGASIKKFVATMATWHLRFLHPCCKTAFFLLQNEENIQMWNLVKTFLFLYLSLCLQYVSEQLDKEATWSVNCQVDPSLSVWTC